MEVTGVELQDAEGGTTKLTSAWHFSQGHLPLWHLTKDPNFVIDPSRGPTDASSISEGQMDAGALMVSSDLHYWAGMFHSHPEEIGVEYDNDDPRMWAAEIEPGSEAYLVNRGFGEEYYIPDASKAGVKKVLPLAEALKVQDKSEKVYNASAKISSTRVGNYIKTLAAADPAVWSAYQALREEGKVYVVGGAVRDALLQKEPKDIDLLVTSVSPNRVAQILDDLPGQTDLTGKDFGVYRYRVKGSGVEIALPRSERSTGDRRVDFDVQVDSELPIEDDLLRRDFTVNAMAIDLENGKLVDPYDGAKDIDKRRLKTVHPDSFREDPTRLMRALVASSRHGLTPDESTRHEMESNASLLGREAKERVQAELDKLLKSSNPAGAIRLAQETGILKHIFPEVAENFDYDQNNPHHSHKLGDHLLNVLENVSQKSTDPDLRLTGLLHDIGKPNSAWQNPLTGKSHYYKGPNGEGEDHHSIGAKMAANRLRSLKFPTSRIKRVEHLIENHMYNDFSTAKGARKFLHKVNDEHADDLMILREADRAGKGTDEYQKSKTPVEYQRELVEGVRNQGQPINQKALAINGNDIIALGVKPGPQIGTILNILTQKVVERPWLNTHDQLISLVNDI
jgi:tRNA nucleotidyltransferase (CCA-adding enzyme)